MIARRIRSLAVLCLFMAVLTLPTHALALSTYREGTAGRQFSVDALLGVRIVTASGDARIVPRTAVLWQYASPSLDPRSVQDLGNGHVLIASRDSNRVLEVDAAGSVVWTYTMAEYQAAFDTDAVFSPFGVQRFRAADGSQHTLITLRKGYQVFELDAHKNVIWHYGTGVPGSGPGQLIDGYSATRLSTGNTLIADNQGARVIEVNQAGQIVWQCGIAGQLASEHGYAPGYLDWPRTAQRIDATPGDGVFTTLIADEGGQRVIEVNQAGQIVWQFGQTGVPGTGAGQLYDPAAAVRLADGSTMIIDNPNKIGRILRVAKDKSVLRVYPDPEDTPDGGALGTTRSISMLGGSSPAAGAMIIADEGNDRILRIGYEPSAKLTSRDVDCGLPGVNKRFAAIGWRGNAPAGSSVSLYYSINGGAWKTAGAGKRTALPAGTVGTRIKYRVVLTTTAGAEAPRVDDVFVESEPAADHEPTTGGSTTKGSPRGGTTTTATIGSHSASSTPSGAKSSGGFALASDSGVVAALDGPLEAAAGHVLAAGVGATPGLPGTGGTPGGTGGTAAALGLIYVSGIAWQPLSAWVLRLLPWGARIPA